MKRFKIGLDILADVPGQSGQVNIHRNTLLWLPRLAPEWTFYAFATPRLQTYYEAYGIGAPNLQWLICWADNTDGTLQRMATQELQVSWLAWRFQIHCMLVYPLPFFFPRARVATIYRHTLSPTVLVGLIGWYRRQKIKFSALASDAVFCNSEYALTELQHFVKRNLKQKAVIFEAFDDKIFSRTSTNNETNIRPEIVEIVNNSDARLLVPSGLQPHKNPLVVFQMLTCLEQAGHRLPQVIFVGNNSTTYAAFLHEKYLSYFRNGTVVVLGFCSHEELAYLGRNATLAIYPSKIETFGVPPLEMMALGVPVLVSNAGPLPEISGPGAELFDPNDPSDLAQKVTTLLDSSTMRESLASRGIGFVQRYSWERNAREILALIKSVLKQKLR